MFNKSSCDASIYCNEEVVLPQDAQDRSGRRHVGHNVEEFADQPFQAMLKRPNLPGGTAFIQSG
jgi:hypothetical protein